MLDIKRIKENPDAVKAGLRAKEMDCDAVVDRILELDVQVRSLKTATETKTAEKNKLSKENGKLFGMKKGAEKKGEDVSDIEAQINANMAASVAIDAAIAIPTIIAGTPPREMNSGLSFIAVPTTTRIGTTRFAEAELEMKFERK